MRRKVLLCMGVFCMVGLLMVGCGKKDDKVDNDTKSEGVKESVEESKEDNDADKEGVDLNDDEKKIFNGELVIYEAKDAGKLCELDLDRDGNRESIEVSKLETDDNNVKKFDIIVNDSKVTFEEENGEYLVVALAFDENNILLATYTNGVSDDPVSVFYKYDGKKLEEVGYISNDIREANKEIDGTTYVQIKGNKLKCWSHEGTLSNYVFRNYKWNGNKLEDIDNGEFEYVDQQEEIRNIKEITIYENKFEKESKSTKIKPGTIIYPLIAGEEGWNYIRTENGDDGWFPVYDNYDAFDRLNLAG